MKKHLSKKSFWQSLLSVAVLGIIFLLAVGTIDNEPIVDMEWLGGDEWRITTYYDDKENKVTTCTGERDGYGRWKGPLSRVVKSEKIEYTEEVNMVDGKRHGKSKTTYKGGLVLNLCYNMGYMIDCKKSAHISTADISAFQVLRNKYPWFLYSLNAFGFEDVYVEPYMDTLETLLYTSEFEPIDFDEYYEDVIDSLSETPYDSIITLNLTFSFVQGKDEVKNDELRMAAIDRYRSDGKTTYNIVKTTYPGYLLSFNEEGVTDQDFEGFCQDLDSLMIGDEALYGPLDLEDPFFLDSVDTRLFRAIINLMETEESSSAALKSMKRRALFYDMHDFNSLYREINSLLFQSVSDSTTQAVAEVVLYSIFEQFDQGDIIKRAVREAYFTNKGVINVPTATTEFEGNNSATSVTVQGYIIEDGGAAVSSRGISWAAFYNPTTNDNSETSGSGIGAFSVTLDGLTEGTTYYARTFATNSAGTAYGNCIQFTATGAVGTNDHEIFTRDFNVYPNPASALATFSFIVGSSENMELSIINLKGQVIYQNDLGSLPQGENKIELDLSGLPNGMYSCQLTSNGTIKGSRKLLIAH
jgi:hypothetical protein